MFCLGSHRKRAQPHIQEARSGRPGARGVTRVPGPRLGTWTSERKELGAERKLHLHPGMITAPQCPGLDSTCVPSQRLAAKVKSQLTAHWGPGPTSVLQGPHRYTRGAREACPPGLRWGGNETACVEGTLHRPHGRSERRPHGAIPHASARLTVLSAGRQPRNLPGFQQDVAGFLTSFRVTHRPCPRPCACVHTHHTHVHAHTCKHTHTMHAHTHTHVHTQNRGPSLSRSTLKGHTALQRQPRRWVLPLLTARSPAGHFGYSWDKMGSLPVSSLGEHPQKQPPQCSKARAGTGTMGEPAETPQPAQDLQRQALRCALRRGGGLARGLRGRRLRCFLRGQPERGELEPGLAAPTQAQAPRPVWDALAGPCFGSKREKG